MKKIVLASLLLSFNFLTFCQNKKPVGVKVAVADSTPPALRARALPDFKVLTDVIKKDGKQDSIWFTNDSFPSKKPIVFVYFSPECGHCQHEMKEIEKNMDSLKNAFFLFVCNSRFLIDSVKSFEAKYNTAIYPNMVLGKELTYFLPVYYNIGFTPYMAIYDTKRNFVKAYDQGTTMPELIKLLRALPSENVIDKKTQKKHGAK